MFRGSGVWSAYLCANVRRRGLRREGRLNCLSSYFVVFLARRACDYTLRRFCGRRSQTRRKCSFIKRPRTGRPRLATRQGPLSPSCKKDNTCENSVFVWAPGTLVQIHTAGVCVISCSVRKWGAPHFRHYGESFKMVSGDSKPVRTADCPSNHSPFYHCLPSEIRKSIRFLSFGPIR